MDVVIKMSPASCSQMAVVIKVSPASCTINGCGDQEESCILQSDGCGDQDESCILQSNACGIKSNGCGYQGESCILQSNGCGYQGESCILQSNGCGDQGESCILQSNDCGDQGESCILQSNGCGGQDESCILQSNGCGDQGESCILQSNGCGGQDESCILQSNGCGDQDESCILHSKWLSVVIKMSPASCNQMAVVIKISHASCCQMAVVVKMSPASCNQMAKKMISVLLGSLSGRLLRAYNIEFNWYRLASWINVVEQWPYRVSWIILFFEENDNLDSSTTLKEIYNKITEKIPMSKEIEPLLEIDRNARKLEAFLSSKSGNMPLLNIGDLKKFLPCTINLDPYLRKQIRELQHSSNILQADISLGHHHMYPGSSVPGSIANPNLLTNTRDNDQGFLRRGNIRSPAVKQPMTGPIYHPSMMPYGPMGVHPQFMPYMMGMSPIVQEMAMGQQPTQPPTRHSNPSQFLRDYQPICLYKLSKEEVCDLLNKIEGISPSMLSVYQQSVCENNLTGLVLANCDMSELGKVMEMKFGDWQLFRSAVEALKEEEEINFEQDQRLSEPLLSPSYNGSVSRRGSISKGKSAPVQGNQSNISITDFDNDPQSSRQALFNNVSRQISAELSKSNYTLNDFMEGGNKFEHIPEEEEGEAEAELSTVNQLDLKRNNSVVAQLQYEAGLLHEAMQNFAEPVQEDEQEQEEGDPSTETFGIPVQFNLTLSHEPDSSETDSNNSAIKLQQENQEDENSRHLAELENFKSVTDGTQAEWEGMLKKSPDQPKFFSETEIFKAHTYEYHRGEHSSVDTADISQLPPGFLRMKSVDTQSVSSVGFATGEMSPKSQLSNSLNDSLDIITETRDTQEFSRHGSVEEGIHIYSESGKHLKRPRSRHNTSEELPLLENSGKYFVTSNSRKPGDPESFV
ncbi:hypothetical protein CHS0354_014081 [Potamilus streckersoni]|uniref:Kinase D-interacting substrate of 220 kDa-like SAM domain-containing protein n=1 Tax=Potamilus streckersoni TaxID=2493646 RepID=A0AAE0VGI8_9BIVA|nr:hypothetical protein CHS0354_014081 [Potamilus streckersoni]